MICNRVQRCLAPLCPGRLAGDDVFLFLLLFGGEEDGIGSAEVGVDDFDSASTIDQQLHLVAQRHYSHLRFHIFLFHILQPSSARAPGATAMSSSASKKRISVFSCCFCYYCCRFVLITAPWSFRRYRYRWCRRHSGPWQSSS